MGIKRQVLSGKLADKCRQERFSENAKVLKIAPLVIVFVSALYLLQYRFFPGREVESIYHRTIPLML